MHQAYNFSNYKGVFYLFIAPSLCAGLQSLPTLASTRCVYWAAILCGLGLVLYLLSYCPYLSVWLPNTRWRAGLVLLIYVLLVFSYLAWRLQTRFSDQLADSHNHQTAYLLVQVSGLPQINDTSLQFDAKVLQSRPSQGIPRQIRLSYALAPWAGPYTQAKPTRTVPPIKPGDTLAFYALLKRPESLLNPGQSDRRAYLLSQGIRALGTIKSEPKGVLYDTPLSLSIWLQKIRYQLRQRLQSYWQDKPYGGVLLALVLGDQQGIKAEDWQLFKKAGISHLVAISGTHIGLCALLTLQLVTRLWSWLSYRGKRLSESRPAQATALSLGLLAALAYSLLAGWGIPAQRSFLMLFFVVIAQRLRLNASTFVVLLLAANCIILLDPWALLSPGFFLSFMAVWWLTLLFKKTQKGSSTKQRFWLFIKQYCASQLLIFFGLAPVLMLFFSQVSVLAPLVNLYAIFVVGSIVTPLSLFFAVWVWIPGLTSLKGYLADVIHAVLAYTLDFTHWLCTGTWAIWDTGQPTWWGLGLSLLGLYALHLSRLSRAHVLWLVPVLALWWRQPPSATEGTWRLVALDIGQGGSVLISTAKHHILFDSGLRRSYQLESANQVILPVLRSLHIKQLDRLIISHSDLDHVGGYAELVSQIPVTLAYAPFRLDKWLQDDSQRLHKAYTPRYPQMMAAPCYAGQRFSLDGVRFEFVWPAPERYAQGRLANKANNAMSCVLRVQGKFHSAILTGDIGQAQELAMMHHYKLSSDVVMAPHHGSASSSSAPFVAATQPQLVIAQAGLWNKFGHPRPEVVQRWQHQQALFFNTAKQGAVTVNSDVTGLHWYTERQQRARYWYE
ncbi:DNA internalization-related competence protein ComEC/Rec2 [Brackiella oedipodis]|uniref:DNA internalization-related competence protein ComEC/Rec2 n=1 Tax=Brackiella oedipodis TaxID=124225 RepID=UPI0006865FD6|nr:DNA internalization-related competence protein ComEC/Rec2 [Brackiella oedipodis]